MPVEKIKNFFLSLYKKKTSLFVLFFILIIPLFVLAQELEVNYPEIFGEKPETVQYGLPQYVKYIFNFAVAAIGLIAFVALIWGGILYLSSAGKPERLKEGKDRIFFALIGLIILAFSYIILTTIDPDLLIFEFPPLTPVLPGMKQWEPITVEEASLILEELPIGQMATDNLWEKEKTERIKKLNLDLETFLNEKIEIKDSNLENNNFNLISDLNKYLKTVTDECRSENLTAICTKPELGSMPIGCDGDPCQTDQGDGVEPDSARDRINKAIAIDREKIKTILDYQEKFTKEKDLLREELRKFQEVQAEITSCQSNNKELILLNNYLSTKQFYEKQGDRVALIKSYAEPKGNPLTFYCTVGGTVFDDIYSASDDLDYGSEETDDTIKGTGSYEIERISCPVEVPTGETLDELRELAVLSVFKLERVSLLLADLAKQTQEMTESVSQCNSSDAEISCNCIPNPCYQCCSPIPCGPCVLFCRSRCLQGVGGCSGEACPVAEIQKKVEQIKETEDKIFKTIEEIKLIFPGVAYNLNDPKNQYNLKNLSAAVGLCYSSDIYNPDWGLFNCENSLGYYGPSGYQIADCHPRNLYCCSAEQGNPPLPLETDASPIYIPIFKEFQPLPAVENCPFAWLCSDNVKNYNQYEDASEPLKQLLSCMRARLDRTEQREELTQTIGLISAISDEKLYQGTCDWEVSPENPGNCSYNYELNRLKPRISAHYGGLICRNYHQSYAIDLDMSSDFQKAYIDEIIATAKECSSEAYILDKTTHLHIDIGNANDCGSIDF
ncbi:MAG: hypothetical protein Q8N58_00520 [bacterium]|nr:hypothetical protein [bacterium]